uniref:Uncharacterized protein n=1 Tax=Rhizophora mucronata TaxID=61149 RepID=A0A2P2K0F2_RHIMU
MVLFTQSLLTLPTFRDTFSRIYISNILAYWGDRITNDTFSPYFSILNYKVVYRHLKRSADFARQ